VLRLTVRRYARSRGGVIGAATDPTVAKYGPLAGTERTARTMERAGRLDPVTSGLQSRGTAKFSVLVLVRATTRASCGTIRGVYRREGERRANDPAPGTGR
jgi:hypothetical protein